MMCIASGRNVLLLRMAGKKGDVYSIWKKCIIVKNGREKEGILLIHNYPTLFERVLVLPRTHFPRAPAVQ